MYTSVQSVFLIDVNSCSDVCYTKEDLERHVRKIKLCCLRLLTEFGAQTEKGREAVRWACKYYDSRCFKPATANKNFADFKRCAFESFENEVTDRYERAFETRNEGPEDESSKNLNFKPHCYILNKALQEVLLDYNWDRPDISSPVKPVRRKSLVSRKTVVENEGAYNAVVVFTRVPSSLQQVWEFCGATPADGLSAEDWLLNVLDPASFKGFQEDKQLRLYFVDVSDESICSKYATPLFTTLQGGLRQLQGGLFSIGQIIQSSVQKVGRPDHDADFDGSDEQLFRAPDELVGHPVFPISVTWWQGHKARGKGRRSRRPQPGPKLVWEDNTGCSFLQVPLEVLAVHGSSSRPWGYAWVVSVIASHAMSVVAIAGSAAQLYVCREPSNETFATIIKVLAQQQLTMILKLEGGGLALLSPWTGGVGCLAIMSSSHLATPPLKVSQEQQEASADKHLLEFVQQTVKKCLSNAPRHETGEPLQTTKAFCTTHIEKWYRPHHGHSHIISRFKKTVSKRPERKAMLERVQKKYKPNIPTPLAAGEVGVCDLVDITQLETGTPAIAAPQAKKAQTSVSRAQQLLKKSRIVTAQQKVKDQRAEEEERVQASERRAAQASERTRKSQALASQALNTVSDPMDSQQLVKSIIAIRDGKSVGGYNEMECDLFTTAQTVINVTLTHIRKSSSKDIEGGLGSILGEGVFQSTTEISKNTNGEEQLRHFKLQALLHLEVLWILGFSTNECEDKENEDNPVRDYHIDETVKMLRSISLKHNPVTMTTFLQEVILENYADTLGEVLVEIYEELNQPLPPQLTALTDDPASVKSHASSVMSCVVGSLENAESNRSREGRNKVARQLSILEAPKRQIVVPVMNRTLRRTVSENIKPQPQNSGEPSQTAESGELRNVRRSLFELEEPGTSKRKLKRSQTVSSMPTTQLRQSPRKAVKKNLQITPKKSKSQVNKKREKAHSAPDGLPKGEKTPTSKRSLLVPETPYNKAGQNVYFKHRLRKSTGSTVVNESPDLKRLPCKTTPRRLRASLTLNRRSSFYSGARSRNWERAKNQLLADRIRGSYDRRSLDLGQLKNTSDASFLFSEILSSTQDDVLHNADDDDETPVKEKDNIPQRVLSFGLDDCQKEGTSSPQKSILERPNSRILLEDSPSRNTRAAANAKSPSRTLPKENISTPLKNVRRSLSLGTPRKDVKSENGNNVPHCPVTPRRGKSLLDVLTPSKRVQFDFNNTPSKSSSPINLNQTPRSILKTPQRTPNKTPNKTPCKTPNKTPCKTPSRTPNKLLFRSPDFAGFSNKKSPRTPVKTPTRTPPRFERTPLRIAVNDIKPFSVTETESNVNCDSAVPETPLKGMSSCSDDSGGLVPETPVKEVDMYSRLVSGVEGNRLEIEPLEKEDTEVLTGVEECGDHMEEMPLLQDIRIDLDSDALGGLENNEDIGMPTLPNMAPEDIELVSTLMFSTDPDPDSGHGTVEFLEGEEDVDSDIKNIINILSTPIRGGSPNKEMSSSTSVDGSGLKLNLQNVFDILKSPIRKGKTPDKLTEAVESFRTQCSQEQTPEQEKVKLNDGVSPEIALSKSFKLYMERMAKELSRLSDGGTPEKTPRTLTYGTVSPLKAQALPADVDKTPQKRLTTSVDSEESPKEGTTRGYDKASLEGTTKVPARDEASTEKKGTLSDSKTRPEKKSITPVNDKTSPERLTVSSEDESNSKTSSEKMTTSSDDESSSRTSPEKVTSSEDELSPKASSEKITSSEDELSLKASPEKMTSSSSEDELSTTDKRKTKKDEASPEERKNPTNNNVSSEERIIFKETVPEDDKTSSKKSKDVADGMTTQRKKGTTMAEGNGSPVKRTSLDRVKREKSITPEFNEVKPENRRTILVDDEGTPEKRGTTGADYKTSPRKREVIATNCKVNAERRRASPSDDEERVAPSSDRISQKKRISLEIGKRNPERRTSLRRQTSPEDSSGTTSDDKISQRNITTLANNRVRPEKRKSTQPLNKRNQKKRRTDLVDDSASLDKGSVSAGLEETTFEEDQTADFEARNVVSQVADGLKEDKTADSEASNVGTLVVDGPRVDKENLEEEDQLKKSRSSRRKLIMTDCKASLSFDEETEVLSKPSRKTVHRKRRSDCDLLMIDKGKSSSGSEEDSLSLLGRLRKRKKKCQDGRLRKRTRLFEEDSDFSSPQSKHSQWELKVKPLRNLENLPSRRESEQSEAYQDQEYDRRKEPALSTSLSHVKASKSPDNRHKQQKIDMYLSPVPKQCCNVETAVARVSSGSSSTPTRKRPETPNDWKRVKPRHEKQRIKNAKAEHETSVEKVSISSGYSLTGPTNLNDPSKENTTTSKVKGKGKSRRHRGVKLKLTKSGEHYQVSSNNVHDSSNDQDKSLNSSQEKFEESFQSSTQEVSSVKKHKKKKKKEKNTCVITPLRFTRHMSKDLSVSPELFQRLITLSPDRSASQDEEKLTFGDEELGTKVEEELEQQFERLDSEFESPEDPVVSDSDSDYAPPGVSFGNRPPRNNPRPARNTKQTVEAIWSVHTLPGSPITTKTFVRKQKKTHVSHTPKVRMTPITSKEPSPQSLMQLTNSPIIQLARASSSHIPTTQLRSRKRLYRGRRDS